MENQIVLSMTNVLTILGGFLAIFGWFYMLISKKFDRVEGDIKEVRSDVKDVRERLIVIEVEAKNTNQRLSTIEGYLVPKKVFRIEEPHSEEPKEN